MHWPQATKPSVGHGAAVADDSISFLDTWKSLEALIAKHPDKVKAIGVSNFSETTLQALLPHCKIVPAVNQIE